MQRNLQRTRLLRSSRCPVVKKEEGEASVEGNTPLSFLSLFIRKNIVLRW
nr:MAG TPA: hypothetical protein [Caudoviricetes sp.]